MTREVDVLVIGAGAAGLGAACWLKEKKKDFVVVEGSPSLPSNMHNGVHYLHSVPSVPFEVDLRSITLTDGIIYNDEIHHTPNLKFSLEYSEKVREVQHPSSIMDVGKKERVFMPEDNDLNSLIMDMYIFAGSENFMFGWWLEELDPENKIACFKSNGEEFLVHYNYLISAIPLNSFNDKIMNLKSLENVEMKSNPVYVTNFKVEKIVPNWLINLYVPQKGIPVYRLSILNNVCSVESISELSPKDTWFTRNLIETFFHLSPEEPEVFTWNTGKVMSITIDERLKVVEELKSKDIYQIGRFGLWNRKLLIDSTILQAKFVVDYINGIDWESTREVLIK